MKAAWTSLLRAQNVEHSNALLIRQQFLHIRSRMIGLMRAWTHPTIPS